MYKKVPKILSLVFCLLLCFEQSGFAQVAAQLDISSHLAGLHSALFPDKFRPLHLRYLSYDSLNNSFKLLLDKGDLRTPPSKVELEDKTKTLLNYFFIGISLPNDSFWVNLRPDAEDNIIDPELAKTDVGKILLEADLQLKKDTAKFTSPETPEGRLYWDKLYQKAGELFGSENITIPTLTRPWIVPDEIIIRESQDNAYIYKATLKVMLEQDYLKDSAMYGFKDERLKQLNEYSSQLIRELIIPKLTKEVNTSKRYAPLRQVYYSLILAQWFKQKFYGRGGLYSWLIDKKNLNGLTSKESWSKTAYFKAYQASFKDGEYNIKESAYTPYGQTIRSYFSGGVAFTAQNILASIQRRLIQAKANIGQRLDSFQERLDYLIEVLVNGGPELATVTIERTNGNVQRANTPSNFQQHPFSETKEGSTSSSAEPGAAGEKGDVNLLAASIVMRLPHSLVNDYISRNLPDDLKDGAAKIKNYREKEGYGIKARLISIKGLFKATQKFGHIGLGQIYGEPVMYIDEDYQENQDVINHELYEIAKWEEKRQQLSCSPPQMRKWILAHYEEALALAENWHKEAPSLNAVFAKAATELTRENRDRIGRTTRFTFNIMIDEIEKLRTNDVDMEAVYAHIFAELNGETGPYLNEKAAREKAKQVFGLEDEDIKDSRSGSFKIVYSVDGAVIRFYHPADRWWHAATMQEAELAGLIGEDTLTVRIHKVPGTLIDIAERAVPADHLRREANFADHRLWLNGLRLGVTMSPHSFEMRNLEKCTDLWRKVWHGINQLSPLVSFLKDSEEITKNFGLVLRGDKVYVVVIDLETWFGYRKFRSESFATTVKALASEVKPIGTYEEVSQVLPEIKSLRQPEEFEARYAELIRRMQVGPEQMYPQERDVNLGAGMKEPVAVESAPPAPGTQKVSSSVSDKGGIDFRGLPIVTQPMPVNRLSSSPVMPLSVLNMDLNEEWSQIQNMLNAGIIPSSQRIKEYLIACCKNGDFNQEIDKVLSCIANILRLEEDNCCATEASFREILSLLESDKSAEELSLALANITPQPQDPKAQPSP